MATRGIPPVRKWLVNYWRDGKVVASCKVDAPTKFLAMLNERYEHAWQGFDYDRRTITPIRATRNAGKAAS